MKRSIALAATFTTMPGTFVTAGPTTAQKITLRAFSAFGTTTTFSRAAGLRLQLDEIRGQSTRTKPLTKCVEESAPL
jgi:hypothetical protein